MKVQRIFVASTLALLVGLAAGACGDDKDDDSEATKSTTSTEAADASPAPSPDADESTDSFVGTWVLGSMTLGIETVTRDQIVELGLDMSIDIRADGTLTIVSTDPDTSTTEQGGGTWTATSATTITATGDTEGVLELTLSGTGDLTMFDEETGMTLVFVRS